MVSARRARAPQCSSRTAARASVRAAVRGTSAAAAAVALALGLLATPTGAVAAIAAPSGTPAPEVTETVEPDARQESPGASDESPAAPDDGETDAVTTPPGTDADAADAPEAATEPEPPLPASPDGVDAPAIEVPADEADARAPPLARQLSIGILAAGIPEAPRDAWVETFEQGVSTTAPSALGAYAGGRYTASTGWVNGASCTGVLVNFSAAASTTLCPPQTLNSSTLGAREVRRLADVLGQLAAGATGSTSATAPANSSTATTRTNHALTNFPYAAVAGGTTVAQSAAGIGVTAPGSRYYALRFDAAGAQCGTNNASLSLSLFTGSTTLLSGFPTPVVPCAATGSVFYTSPAQATSGILDPALSTSARAATYTGTGVALLTPAQIAAAQVRLTNTVTGAGSAFGVDNIRVLEVSPALDAAFSGTATATVPTTLTYTVTNTSDLLAKTDWGFAATLPAELRVAATPAIGGTCVNATGAAYAVTAAPGSGAISVVGGDLVAGASSCTITVDVVAAAAGTVTSGAVATTGLIASAPATLTVQPATTLTVRKNLPARAAAGDQFTLSVRSGQTVLGSATTSGSATGLQAQQVAALVVQPGATYTIHETITAGAGLTYTSSYECTRDGTVIAIGSSPSGTLTMPAEAGSSVVCTFTNTVQSARLSCSTNQFYALGPAGELLQADTVTGATATVGSWNVGANANSLGIGPGGGVAYALQRSTDAANVVSILKWTPAGGFQTLANTGYTTATTAGAAVTGSLVAGAVDPSGRFIFGKFSGTSFHLWSFTESNPAATRYAYLGSFPTTGSPNGNGDLAFDASGNLYVLGAATVNNAPSAVIFTVTAAAISAANGGVIPVGATTARSLAGTEATPAFGNANGLAFSPRGTAYVSDSGTAYEFDPTTWTRIPGSGRSLAEHTDLASCASPSTVTVLKNAIGRAAASDQFTLTLSGSAGTIATATTAGSATGRQSQQVGPVPIPTGSTVSISEAMAAGSASALAVYTIFSECWADGVRLSNSTAATGSVTVPERPGVNVVCTFFNSPRPATTVTITKLVLDPATGATSPAAGWSVGTAATATTGTATALPSEAPRQLTNAQGTASWTVLYGSLASRATLTVSEEMRAGFVFASASCTIGGTATPVTFGQTGNIVSGSIANTQSAQAIACTIVNRPVAVLTLVKEVSFGSALPSDWVLSATAPTGALPGPSGRSGTPQASAINVTPGVPYRLSEAGGSLTYVQTGAWQCRTDAGTAVAVTAAGDVTLPQGATVTCAVTNATASVTLLKQVTQPGPGFQPANWTVTATPAAFAGGPLPTQSRPGAAYVASGNPASTFEVRPGHTYTLSEAPTTPGSRLAYQTLRLERLQGTTWVSVPSATISAPAAGQNAVYRFVNAPVQPTTLPLTGGMSSDAFLISGGAILAIVLAGAVLHDRRRRRPM
ncbi:DUF7933 domain-containing protein [Microbacterium radiodurans]|uniref:LPXTG cell wall anchor domain-containing protein n=1 Tax=Microbacterium radiodurans TaxID=661398 RepID=A0A5J5IS40_9MICO|nr:LPXTG cell wall anchor domain-containing protein [Microbacterium radiodurans]KAA9088994.1 LPXTG cell wall anchor domain-containing protein [Microbacterium radiodurans]